MQKDQETPPATLPITVLLTVHDDDDHIAILEVTGYEETVVNNALGVFYGRKCSVTKQNR